MLRDNRLLLHGRRRGGGERQPLLVRRAARGGAGGVGRRHARDLPVDRDAGRAAGLAGRGGPGWPASTGSCSWGRCPKTAVRALCALDRPLVLVDSAVAGPVGGRGRQRQLRGQQGGGRPPGRGGASRDRLPGRPVPRLAAAALVPDEHHLEHRAAGDGLPRRALAEAGIRPATPSTRGTARAPSAATRAASGSWPVGGGSRACSARTTRARSARCARCTRPAWRCLATSPWWASTTSTSPST